MTISGRHVFLECFEKDYPYLANSVGEGAYGIAYFGGVRGKGLGTVHTAGAAEIWIDQSGFSRREKLYCLDVNVC